MKYVVIRCEDHARSDEQVVTLLEGAKVSHLQHLSQAGAGGRLQYRGAAPEHGRFELHRALLGLLPDDRHAAPAGWYAASANVQVADGETAWCCDLVTQQDGRVIDPAAGRITTRESRSLLQALNESAGGEAARWEVGDGSHHLLLTREPVLAADDPQCVPATELIAGTPWRSRLPKGPLGEALKALLEKAAEILEAHPVNRVRLDLGENPANAIWCWGPARGSGAAERHGSSRSGVVLSAHFALRGLARACGLGWMEAPTRFEAEDLQRLRDSILALVERNDVVYVHLRIESAEPVDRLVAMERIDQLVLRPLTETLPKLGPWRLLVAVDDRQEGTVPFIAIGTGLPQQPVPHLDGRHLAESPLAFPDGQSLFAWFSQ